MTSLVVCFSGRIGSGKTSVSRAVANALNTAWTGFGDFVRFVAMTRSLDTESRGVLQQLGAQLIHDHGVAWLCEQVIARAEWDGRRILVVDGVRHVAVLDEIIRQLSEHHTVLVHLELQSKNDPKRGMDAASRHLAEMHSTEEDVFTALPARADLLVATDRPIELVVESVLDFVRGLASRPRESRVKQP